MEYSTEKTEEGVELKLGNFAATFEKGASMEDVCNGVEKLIEVAVGVSAFELVLSVVKAMSTETTDG